MATSSSGKHGYDASSHSSTSSPLKDIAALVSSATQNWMRSPPGLGKAPKKKKKSAEENHTPNKNLSGDLDMAAQESDANEPANNDPASSGLSAEQLDWFQKTLGDSFTRFGTGLLVRVDSKVEQVESRCDEKIQRAASEIIDKVDVQQLETEAKFAGLEQKIAAMQQKMAEVEVAASQSSTIDLETDPTMLAAVKIIDEKAKQSIQQLQAEHGKVTKDLEQQAKAAATTASRSNRRVTLQPFSGTPYHERTEARMGGLGWNKMGDELSKRARSMLERAGYTDHQAHVSCVQGLGFNPGSIVKMTFDTPQELRRAKDMVQQMQHVGWDDEKPPPDRGRPVWLDVAKTAEERRPMRCLNEATKFLEELEACQECPLEVVADRKTKQIKVANKLFAFVCQGELKVSTACKHRYDAGDIDTLLAYASG